MKKLVILFFVCFLFVSLYISENTTVKSAYITNGIESFPSEYKPYLYELNKKYPNWKFEALYTELDWNYVVNNENVFGKNLVPKSYSDSWKNTNSNEYNIEVDSGWVDSSRRAVEYAMDPRNFLNPSRIFQFEELLYSGNTNNLDTIEKILYGTEFYNRTVDYYTSVSGFVSMQEKYSELILRAGQTSLVSPFHLASRIKQEVGPFLSHSSISGRVSGYEGLYNFYNIGATSSSEPMGAILNGLRYARDGKGASEANKTKYLIPWENKERAITGGGIFIGSGYINRGQSSIYLQKFHVNDNTGGSLFWHQYMTNVLAPYSEGKSIYNGYLNSGIIGASNTFTIPIYENMPNEISINPNINLNDFVLDNTKVYADVQSTLNVRTGPSTSYDILTSIDRNQIMTRILKGNQSGELWDKVLLESGMVGYVFNNYLVEVPEKVPDEVYVPVKDLELDKTEIFLEEKNTAKITYLITPSDATNQQVKYATSNQAIATVDDLGVITGVLNGNCTVSVTTVDGNITKNVDVNVIKKILDEELSFNENLVVGDNEISNLDYTNNTVDYIKSNINTIYNIEIYDKNNKLLEADSRVGTGSILKVLDEEDNEIINYTIILYGDVNGDGKINSVDLLVLQRHILEIQRINGAFFKAGNINKNGKNPSSLDLLLIQRHILEIGIILQK